MPSAALQAFADFYRAQTPEEAMYLACVGVRERAGETLPPIGLRKIAQLLNARVVERAIQTAGRLEVDQSGYLITAKHGTAWRRQRFTVAHEIAHILILDSLAHRPDLLGDLRSDRNWEYVERLCNLGAAELLVPATDFPEAVSRLTPRRDAIQVLYDRYLCSFATLLLRFVDLFPRTSLTFWRDHARHGGELKQWRVVRCFTSDGGTWLPEGLTGKHLRPNIVRQAAVNGVAADPNLLFELSSRTRRVYGVASALGRDNRTKGNEPPTFADFRVPDEPGDPSTVALLLWPKTVFCSDDTASSGLVKWLSESRQGE